MYEASVPEKVIIEMSGHLSKDGARSYKRTSVKQVKSICSTLSPLENESKPEHDSRPGIKDVKEDGAI